MDANWKGRKILHPDDTNGLDTRAAVYELHHRHPREVAEAKSYDDYKRQKAVENAAHHMVGMKIAHLVNDDTSAKKHSEAYSEAIRALGLDPSDQTPPEVEEASKKTNPYKYKAHQSDALFQTVPDEAETKPDPAKKLLETLQKLKVARGI